MCQLILSSLAQVIACRPIRYHVTTCMEQCLLIVNWNPYEREKFNKNVSNKLYLKMSIAECREQIITGSADHP